jgi:uncharacterized protein DUF3105
VAKKKKSRVPAPPRPVQAPKRSVQAPQRRVEHRVRAERSSRMWFLALGAVIVVAAAAVGIFTAVRGGGGAQASGVDGACVRQTFPPQGHQHVQELAKNFLYNSFPPTSGPHFPTPAVYNVYDQPVPEIRLVHNLEHGAIVVQYGSKVTQAAVQQIVAWYAKSPLGMVVAPLATNASELHATPPPGADKKIFLTAWTHVATCSAFDEKAFTNFRDDYRGPKGDSREKFPLSALQPGGT